MSDKWIDRFSDLTYYGRKWEELEEMDEQYHPPSTKTHFPAAAPKTNRKTVKASAVQKIRTNSNMTRENSQNNNGKDNTVNNNQINGKMNNRNQQTQGYSQGQQVSTSNGVETRWNLPSLILFQNNQTDNTMNNDNQTDRQNKEPYKCYQGDHNYRQCPKNPCFFCYQPGHYAASCPKRESLFPKTGPKRKQTHCQVWEITMKMASHIEIDTDSEENTCPIWEISSGDDKGINDQSSDEDENDTDRNTAQINRQELS
ncbi:putative uncharacterized protein DDB_G0289963 [Phymastichus coffea]|uniref:putative uncharacterized protein DDB_G0289963 n=1 Tax=Phymastichus coffea TaxID=108790 RepID=UPI00273BDB33|nr:putative uncharacterized protein DDB_G0289963 [Phymastichus coffea]